MVEGGRTEGFVRSVDGEREKVTAAAEARGARSAGNSQIVEKSIMSKRQFVVFSILGFT